MFILTATIYFGVIALVAALCSLFLLTDPAPDNYGPTVILALIALAHVGLCAWGYFSL